MDSRKLLEQHIQTLNALMRGGLHRGMGSREEGEDELQSSLRGQWEMERNILRRVLSERGDPVELLLAWRERTQGFIDKYPERDGWTDREGTWWGAHAAMEAIDKLLEQVEAWEEEVEAFDDDDFDETE